MSSLTKSFLNKELRVIFQTLQNCKQISKDDRLFLRRYLVQNLRQWKGSIKQNISKEIKVQPLRINQKATLVTKRDRQLIRLIQILINKDLVVVQMQLRKVLKALKEKEHKILFFTYEGIRQKSLFRENSKNRDRALKSKQKSRNHKNMSNKSKDPFSLSLSKYQKQNLPNQNPSVKIIKKSIPKIEFNKSIDNECLTPRHRIDLNIIKKGDSKSYQNSQEKQKNNSEAGLFTFKNIVSSDKKIRHIKLIKKETAQDTSRKQQKGLQRRLSLDTITASKQEIVRQQKTDRELQPEPLTQNEVTTKLPSPKNLRNYFSAAVCSQRSLQVKIPTKLSMSNPLNFTDTSLYKSKLQMIQNRDFIRTSETTQKLQKIKSCLNKIFAQDLYCFLLEKTKYNQKQQCQIKNRNHEIQNQMPKSNSEKALKFNIKAKFTYKEFLQYLKQFTIEKDHIEYENFLINQNDIIIPPFENTDDIVTERGIIQFIETHCLQSANKIRAYFVQLDRNSSKVISVEEFQRVNAWKGSKIIETFKKLVEQAGNENCINYWQMYLAKDTKAFKQFQISYFK